VRVRRSDFEALLERGRTGPPQSSGQARGVLTNRFLLSTDGLNVKRSSFVCALLAELPEVNVESTRPITLRLRPATLRIG
jgi:hypothetical protein